MVHWRCKFSLVRKKCIGISVVNSVLTQSYLLICSLEGICKAVEEDLGAVLTAAVHHAAVTQFALTHFTRVRLRRARQPDSGCTDDANENETLTNQSRVWTWWNGEVLSPCHKTRNREERDSQKNF